MRTVLLSLVLISPPIAGAENSYLATWYNQYQAGVDCSNLDANEIKTSGFNCNQTGARVLNDMRLSAAEMAESLVYTEAAKHKLRKNKCLNQQVAALRDDPNHLTHWAGALYLTWLKMKKAQIMRETCWRHFWSKLDNAEVSRHGLRGAWDRRARNIGPLDEKSKKWLPVCTDQKVVDGIRNAEELFKHALPVVSTPELFKIMEGSRELILNDNTQKPLTDAELLNMNLDDANGDAGKLLEFKADRKFYDSILRAMTDVAGQLDKTVAEIEQRKNKNGGYDLDSDTKTELYAEGLVDDVLREAGLSESKIAICLATRFKPTVGGTAFDIFATTVAGGGLTGWVLRSGKWIYEGAKAAAGLQATKTGMQAALMYKVTDDGIRATLPVCRAGLATQLKMADFKSKDLEVAQSAGQLPKEVGYKRYKITFEPHEVPACEDRDQNLELLARVNCLQEAAKAQPLYLSLALPALILSY